DGVGPLAAAPLAPAGIPDVVAREPPVAGPVEPVPRRPWIPVRRVTRAQHLDLHLPVRHRRPEVILRRDGRRHRLSQLHRLLRRLDRDLELGLLVLLLAEARPAHLTLPWLDNG